MHGTAYDCHVPQLVITVTVASKLCLDSTRVLLVSFLQTRKHIEGTTVSLSIKPTIGTYDRLPAQISLTLCSTITILPVHQMHLAAPLALKQRTLILNVTRVTFECSRSEPNLHLIMYHVGCAQSQVPMVMRTVMRRLPCLYSTSMPDSIADNPISL